MKVNFAGPFVYENSFSTFNQNLNIPPEKTLLSVTNIIEEAEESVLFEEEAKLQSAMEKNFHKNLSLNDQQRSFSQFPPNVHKRAVAATIIQKCM